MIKKENFTFIETKKMNLTGYTLIEGFPDLGLAGTIGSKYLIDKLNFESMGYVNSKLLMPIIRIQNGIPMHPVRFYVSKKHKTIIILAEQILPNQIANLMSVELVNWIKKKGIKRVISTSGIKVPNGPSIYAFASDEKSKKLIRKNHIELVQNGITSGVTAMLMLYLKDNKIEAFCLMGNAKNNADYYAASELVKAFCKLTNIAIDVKPLLKEAKKIEAAITNHLKTLEEQSSVKNEIRSTSMYT